jgi:hypothetical protein
MDTPESLVKNFIEDFFQWNNKCPEIRTLQQIEAEYLKIVEKYCRPNFQPLGVAFGSDSRHHPDNEKIISVETFGNETIVKTQNTKDYGFGKFVSDYEFHLSYENERWFLEQIYYVNEEGKYESL